MTTRHDTAEALTAAACTNLRARARARKDLPIRDRLALQGIAVGEHRGIRSTLTDATSGEPIATMTASEACEFLAWAEVQS